jgi:Glyoxalase superfamily protein
MRDFRDAKAMAQSLRAALAAKGLKITISQSLELIANAFGVADWNMLSSRRLSAAKRSSPARTAARRCRTVVRLQRVSLPSLSRP